MNVLIQRLPVLLVLWVVLVFSTSNSIYAQQRGSIRISGPCAKCTDHLIGTAKSIPGVSDATYEVATGSLVVVFDPGTSVLDIALELSMAGYDADNFKGDPNAEMPACCAAATRGEDDELFTDLEDDEEPLDWENPENLEALERLSDIHEEAEVPEADLEDENGEDADLEDFEEVDVEVEVVDEAEPIEDEANELEEDEIGDDDGSKE